MTVPVGFDDKSVIYVAGRPLKVGDKSYEAGDEVTNWQEIPYLEAFVSSGDLHRVFVGKDAAYGQLPPHLYSAFVDRQELNAKLHEDASLRTTEAAEAAHEAHKSDKVRIQSQAERIVAENPRDRNKVAEANSLLEEHGLSQHIELPEPTDRGVEGEYQIVPVTNADAPLAKGGSETTTDATEEERQDEDDYEDMTKDQLQELLRERDLPTSGNKPELIQRLRDSD